MSENLELMRSIYADWERGEFASRDWADPEIELASPDGPGPGRYIGHAHMASGSHEFLKAWAAIE